MWATIQVYIQDRVRLVLVTVLLKKAKNSTKCLMIFEQSLNSCHSAVMGPAFSEPCEIFKVIATTGAESALQSVRQFKTEVICVL